MEWRELAKCIWMMPARTQAQKVTLILDPDTQRQREFEVELVQADQDICGKVGRVLVVPRAGYFLLVDRQRGK